MADVNTSATQGAARTPRGAVRINGTLVDGWTEWSVDNNRFRAADTFSVTLAASDMTATFTAATLLASNSLTVEIFANESPSDPANYAPSNADRLIYAQVDDIHFDPVSREIEMTGRDLTAKLIDTKTSENHQNATSSQVAILLAQRHGLTPVVTATTTRIGQYYQQDHTDINQQQSEWDLLVRLADFENFDVFVTGNELHFQPKPADDGERYALVWAPPLDTNASPGLNGVSLSFSRSLTIAKGVQVQVRSWNAKQKKVFTANWPKAVKAVKPGQADNETLIYPFHIPGLTQDQASLRAQQKYNQIVQHMVSLDASLPADALLTCATSIQVRGTGTTFDQTYYPDSVRRSMSFGAGYGMTVTAKNISQDIEDAVQ